MDDVIREGNSVLREKAEEVALPPSDEDKRQLEEMIEFLRNSQDPETAQEYQLRPGVGLAAPQINLKKRMIAMRTTDHNDELIELAMFNPKIISHSQQSAYLEGGEGCLSVDRDVPGIVPRYARVKLEAYDLDGRRFTKRLRGFLAIVFQHELDHLNGIMFYDRIDEQDPYKIELPPHELVQRSEDEVPLA
ncbi:peptide deformylase [Salisediminibacterium halotolerans]|uniref:Peptide deformylase n=2 Tax=Salisediminibacterium halotolerans TaxID=517425 RepID=A0A1H9WM66_9BACI|nr:peptide deformylase [Actinophytocola xinjiangensis]TWG35201.1 peptide deformylase [Salisediminibacterium halotolerans]SES34965.1 peptide deformylase [Salisediminibacterium haloalkalitolerans]